MRDAARAVVPARVNRWHRPTPSPGSQHGRDVGLVAVAATDRAPRRRMNQGAVRESIPDEGRLNAPPQRDEWRSERCRRVQLRPDRLGDDERGGTVPRRGVGEEVGVDLRRRVETG